MVGHYIEINNHKIFGYARYFNVYKRVVDSAENGAHFVEVGSFLGQSTAFMSYYINESKKDIIFDAIDLWELGEHSDEPHFNVIEEHGGDFFEAFKYNMRQSKTDNHKGKWIKGDSLVVAKEYENNSLDFVMIDAGHTTEEVLLDINAWLPKIKIGGIIAFDDMDWESVRLAVYKSFIHDEIDIIGTTGIVIKKEKHGKNNNSK